MSMRDVTIWINVDSIEFPLTPFTFENMYSLWHRNVSDGSAMRMQATLSLLYIALTNHRLFQPRRLWERGRGVLTSCLSQFWFVVVKRHMQRYSDGTVVQRFQF